MGHAVRCKLIRATPLRDIEHDLRHSFASELAMSGANHLEIAKLTGHRDLKGLMRYTHLAPEHSRTLVVAPAGLGAVCHLWRLVGLLAGRGGGAWVGGSHGQHGGRGINPLGNFA